ncbi:LOW QUALITY PROTEIN: hypothetical protein TMLG_01111, partial [Mycobacterium tuberculosis SUMu012]
GRAAAAVRAERWPARTGPPGD